MPEHGRSTRRRPSMKQQAEDFLREKVSRLRRQDGAAHQQELKDLEQGLRVEFSPQGVIEEEMFQQILRSMWGIRRIQYLQHVVMDGENDPLDTPVLVTVLERLERHYSSYSTSFDRALKELRLLQKHRRQWTEMLGPNYTEKVPPLANPNAYKRLLRARGKAIPKATQPPTPDKKTEPFPDEDLAGRVDPTTGKKKIWIN